MIGVGEAYDFELAAGAAGELDLRATDPMGRLRLSGLVRISEAKSRLGASGKGH